MAHGSPRGASETTNAESLAALRQAVVLAGAQRERFEVWVTHMFVLSDLTGATTASGEGLVLQADSAGVVKVQAPLALT